VSISSCKSDDSKLTVAGHPSAAGNIATEMVANGTLGLFKLLGMDNGIPSSSGALDFGVVVGVRLLGLAGHVRTRSRHFIFLIKGVSDSINNSC